MDMTDLPGRMMSLQLKDKIVMYNSYMPFLEFGGLFVPTDDPFKMGDEVLLAIEFEDPTEKKFLRTKVAWINPARTSANRPKGVGLAFGSDEISLATRAQIEASLSGIIRNERPTFTL